MAPSDAPLSDSQVAQGYAPGLLLDRQTLVTSARVFNDSWSDPSSFSPEALRRWKARLLPSALLLANRFATELGSAQPLFAASISTQDGADFDASLPRLIAFASDSARALLERGRRDGALAWGRVAYIAERQINHAWLDLFSIIEQCDGLKYAQVVDPSRPSPELRRISRRIVQWDQDYAPALTHSTRRLSWSQKNPEWHYSLFGSAEARLFLGDRLGPRIQAAYFDKHHNGLRANLFSAANLWLHGGLSASLSEECRASVDLLLDKPDVCYFRVVGTRPRCLDPDFLAAPRGSALLARFIKHIVCAHEWMESTGHTVDDWVVSGAGGLTMVALDVWCEAGFWAQESEIRILRESDYRTIVERSESDRNLVNHDHSASVPHISSLPTAPIELSVRAEDSVLERSGNNAAGIMRLFPDRILPAGKPLVVLSSNPDESRWTEDHSKPKLAPGSGIFWLKNVSLTGHGCLWKDNEFIKMDSYLSFVAEDETRRGAWQTPWTHEISRTIDEDVIVAFTAGYGCYGHWLVDDLPRLAMAKFGLGRDFDKIKLVLPHRLPTWAKRLLNYCFGIDDERIIYFDHERERLLVKSAIVPGTLNRDYNFQPYVKEAMSKFAPRDVTPFRRVCLSRGDWDDRKPDQRIFMERKLFEQMAADRGYELVVPETLSFGEQIKLMAEISVQVGEHGSAQHGTIFSPTSTVVGTIFPLTPVQINLGRIAGDRNILLFPDKTWRNENGSLVFTCPEERIRDFFDAVESCAP